MNRRDFLAGSSQLLAASVLNAQQHHPEADPCTAYYPNEASADQPYHPNVIWLIADQWRAQAIAANGDPNVRTPNIDLLCSSGVNFDQARSGFPLCSPFRGSMLTGRYPHHMVPGHQYPLPPGQATIANTFNDAGYHTGFFGKWHLGGFKEQNGRTAFDIIPPDRRGGFQTWIGYENNANPWDCWVHGGSGKDAFLYRLPGFETDELTNLFIKYLKERSADRASGKPKPFFGILSVIPPHNPYRAPAEYMAHYNPEHMLLRPNVPRFANVPPIGDTEIFGTKMSIEDLAKQELAGYYAQIENWDWNVGRIVAALGELGLSDNTHIMVFSDHGDLHGSHGQFRKTSPYEESLRIPMIISGEISFYAGRVTGTPTTLFSEVDVAPTTLGLCGLSAPDWMEGHNYAGHRLRC